MLSLSHQKLTLQLDVDNYRFRGTTQLFFNSTSAATTSALPEYLALSCVAGLVVVDRCSIDFMNDSKNVPFLHSSEQPFSCSANNYPHPIYAHKEFRSHYIQHVVSQQSDLLISLASLGSHAAPTDDELSFVVTVHFHSNSAVALSQRCGYHFLAGSSLFYLSNAQSVFPCLPSDSPLSACFSSVSCTWELEVVVAVDLIVVCSGELESQCIHPLDPSLKISSFSLNHPTAAQNVGICVGHLVMQSLALMNGGAKCFVFCPKGLEERLAVTVGCLPKIFDFLTQHIGASFPFSSFKLVFLPGSLYASVQKFSALCLLGVRWMVDDRVIDEVVDVRAELARCVAGMWFGQYVVGKSWADSWLITGLSSYLAGLFVKKHFGNNEYRFRMKKDMEKCAQIDVGQYPLYPANPSEVILLDDIANTTLTKLKAPIVLYMLEKYLGKNLMQKIINKTIVQAMSGELQSGLSTSSFLKSVKKISGKEPKTFADQWIFKAGTPKLEASFFLNRKKNMIELKVTQDPARPLYIGNLTVRVHEPDGTFDHVVCIEEGHQMVELLYHTKYKRQRQNKKGMMVELKMEQDRFEKERAEGLLPPPGTEQDEAMNENDTDISFEIAKADWKEVDDEGNEINSPIGWIRLDPELDLLCYIEFKQSDFMDSQQLTKDKDVVAQYDVIKRMHIHTNLRVAACLFSIMMDVRTFYRVRMEASLTLATGFAKPEVGAIGLYYLFLAFRKKFCIKNTLTSDNQIVPRRNNFNAFSEYYLLKTIPEALALVRDNYGRTPLTILRLLLSLIQLNDNTGNNYSDHAYISSVVDALGHALLPARYRTLLPSHNEEDIAQRKAIFATAVDEIERLLFLETQVPSYRNAVAISCLRVLTEFSLAKLIPIRLDPFFLFARPSNFDDVRCAALDGLCTLGLQEMDTLLFLQDVLARDPSHYIRNFLAQRLACIMALIAQYMTAAQKKSAAESSAQANRTMSVDVEDMAADVERKVQGRKKTTLSELEKMKKDNLQSPIVMDNFWNILMVESRFDDRTRRTVLSILEGFYDPKEFEAPVPVPEVPKLKLTLKPTPAPAIAPVVEKESDVVVDVEGDGAPAKKIKLSFTLPSNSPKPAVRPVPTAVAATPVPPAIVPAVAVAPMEDVKITVATEVQVTSSQVPTEAPAPAVLDSTQPPPQQQQKPTETPKPKMKLVFKAPVAAIPAEMPAFSKQRAEAIMEKLLNQKFSYFFTQPVDEELHGAPGYYEKIKEPMDFGTLREMLDNGDFKEDAEFDRTVGLVFSNCYQYNNPKSNVCIAAKAIEKAWHKELSKLRTHK